MEEEDTQEDAHSDADSERLEDPLPENSTKFRLPLIIVIAHSPQWLGRPCNAGRSQHLIHKGQDYIKIFTKEPRDYNKLKAFEGNKKH